MMLFVIDIVKFTALNKDVIRTTQMLFVKDILRTFTALNSVVIRTTMMLSGYQQRC